MGCCESSPGAKAKLQHAYHLSNNSLQITHFDLHTGEFKCTFAWNSPLRPGAQYCTLPNGPLFVTGGRTSHLRRPGAQSSNSAASFDSATGEFREKPNMITGRESHAMAVEGRAVYSLTGANGCTLTQLCERWDTVEEEWEPIEALPEARTQASACVVRQRIYLTGGQSLRVQFFYIPVGQWAVANFKLPLDLRQHGSAEYLGGVLVFGGVRADGSPSLSTFWFSTRQQRMLQKSSMPAGALFPCHCLSAGDTVYACEQANGSMLFVFWQDRWVLRQLLPNKASLHNG